jgi:hypothetical protein
MKHLLNGVAIAAALVIAAPVWAQSPTGGNAMGTPGPNPGGPGLTPYSGGAPPAAATSAAPPMHRHARAKHHKMAHHGPALSGDTTAQLNREELARIQAGNMGNPPAPPAPPPMSSGRLPGPKTSGGRNIPPPPQ